MTTHLLAAVLLLCGGFLYLPTCARAEDRFRSPPKPGPTGDYRDNPVYALGDSIDLQWDTSLESADLVLWQEQTYGDAPPASVTLAANAKAKTLVWTVGYAGFPAYHDPGLSPVYYLELSKAGETAAAAGAVVSSGSGDENKGSNNNHHINNKHDDNGDDKHRFVSDSGRPGHGDDHRARPRRRYGDGSPDADADADSRRLWRAAAAAAAVYHIRRRWQAVRRGGRRGSRLRDARRARAAGGGGVGGA
ncbi:hypothetical protein CSUB01_11477 [Colletotrichum sublineola]|uniref:Ser-Thr-rich glycosyl-phosphatidyl-inositol-anchored membrane family protein n=1 Tax=Colletotrichum sublineola TaxID=1173701 RepID=A0A066XSP5_COLSU|nr:hypothetical protein CSUB01_11477 [Colletotrichum sublineola]